MPDPVLYAIDDAAINTRPDWAHQYIPGSIDKSYESFPGDPGLYAINGYVTGPMIAVVGWLEADTEANLFALQRTESLRRERIIPVKVTIEGVDFEECDLKDFRMIGGFTPMSRGTFTGFAVQVRYLWQQLISPV